MSPRRVVDLEHRHLRRLNRRPVPVLKVRVQTPAESFRATIALKLPFGRALSLAEINLTASVTVTASASIWIPRTSSSRIATANCRHLFLFGHGVMKGRKG